MKKELFIGAAAIAVGSVAITVSLMVSNGALNGLNESAPNSQTATEAQGGQEPADSPSVNWTKKKQETARLAAPIVGMTLDDAEAFCKENGLRLRVLGGGMITFEFSISRVNVTLVENVVDHFYIG